MDENTIASTGAAAPEVPPLAPGSPLYLIACERVRQIEVKGWTCEHDDKHAYHELALVAAAYAMPASHRYPALMDHLCPWTDVRIKDPDTEEQRDRELVKAGALIVAELERRQRARAREANKPSVEPREP